MLTGRLSQMSRRTLGTFTELAIVCILAASGLPPLHLSLQTLCPSSQHCCFVTKSIVAWATGTRVCVAHMSRTGCWC